jgi:hypothetical protein
MEEKNKKEFKQILSEAVVPYIIGLRNEIKDLAERVDTIAQKEIPQVDVHVVNPVDDVRVSNLPEKQVVVLADNSVDTGLEKTITENEKKNRAIHKQGAVKIVKEIASASKESEKSFSLLRKALENFVGKIFTTTFSVNVKNQIDFPKVQEVKISNVKELKAPTEIFISNATPREAIPVILTDKDRKRFYSAIQTAIASTDVDLSKTNKLLTAIKTAIDELEVEVTLNTDNLEELSGDNAVTISDVGVEIESLDGTDLATYVVPIGKRLLIKSFFWAGGGNGLFTLYVGDGAVFRARNSWCTPSGFIQVEKIYPAGTTIAVAVNNIGKNTNLYSAGYACYLLNE